MGINTLVNTVAKLIPKIIISFWERLSAANIAVTPCCCCLLRLEATLKTVNNYRHIEGPISRKAIILK
jgi:hypothetical protein